MDQTPYVSRMWVDLQRANRLPKGQVLSSCEDELQELMRQIDIMVQSRKMDWEKDKQTLGAKLDVREQEYMIQKTTLEQKHQEIGELRSKLETLENIQKTKSMEYETQLAVLKGEVGNIKKEYEKLQKRYKHMKERDKSKVSSENDDNAAEIRRLNAKVDEYRRKSRDWEQQKRTHTKQIETIESQKSTLVEKCEFLQTQSSSYQAQLDKRKDMLDSTEMSLKSQITQLEGQLERARDTINSQDTHLSRLKASLEDAILAQRRALEEKEMVEMDLQRSQQSVRNLEDEVQQAQMVVKTKTDILSQTQEEISQMTKAIINMEEQLRQKNNTIDAMEKVSKREQNGQMKKLQTEIQEVKSDLRNARTSESSLQEEVSRMRDRLDDSRQECGQLSAELASKISEIRSLEKNDIRSYRAEVAKLKNEISLRHESHLTESEALKKENAEMGDELESRNSQVASLSEKLSSMEFSQRDQDENVERKMAELQISNAQLEALRLENRHLRKTTLSRVGGLNDQSQTDGDIIEAEKHLRELQSAYTSSVSSLEHQNEQLQSDISHLRHELRKVEGSTNKRIEDALQESQKNTERIRHEENRKSQDVRESGERKLRYLQNKLDATVADYESQIENLQTDMSQMEDELDSRHKSLTRLGMENEVMSNFVDGVDNVVKCPPHRESSILNSRDSSIPSRPLSAFSDGRSYNQEDDEDDFMVDSADLVTANFMAEQQERTVELEKKLDLHIQDLKEATEATVRKYTGR